MAQLVVGGVTIPVAPGNASRDRDDFTDRRRAFDGTYRASQTGGAARTWRFRTPPITRVLADSYEATLGIVAAQMCSGDLLGLPTMCCAQIDSGWNAIKAASGHYVELPFTLHEVQPFRALLKYVPGSVLTGESATRSTIGYYRNISGGLVQAAINEKRDAHYIGGVKSLLLEGPSTNNLPRASEFANAAWTKSTMTIGTGIADPTGGTGACTLTADASNAAVYQHLSDAASVVRTNSVWLRRRTGTGAVRLYDALGSTYSTVSLTTTWLRFSFAAAASVLRWFYLELATSGDQVDAFIGQDEDLAWMTSEIPTTTAAVARTADFYSIPFTTPPQELSVYIKFVEKGTKLVTNGQLFGIENATPSLPVFIGYAPAGLYTAHHGQASGTVASAQAVAPALDDTVEFCARLYGDGSVDSIQSINGGAETTSARSAALALASAWSGPLCWLNSAGTAGNHGYIAIQSFKIIAGMRSFAEMRAA